MLYYVVLLLYILMIGCILSEPICKKQSNKTVEPRFTEELGVKTYVRVSHSKPIKCCAEGYIVITWSRLENNTWVNFPPPPHGDYNTPEVEEDGQILRIFEAEPSDETKYRCEVKGKTQTIKHITRLVFLHCDPHPSDPLLTSPYPINKTITKYGGNVSFPCTGYFGCQDKGDWPLQLAFWTVDKNNVTLASPRYSVEVFSNYTWGKKKAVFTITDVREEDTRKLFYCRIASANHGAAFQPVRIYKEDIPSRLMIWLIIGGAVLFILVVIILVLFCRALYGPQIVLFCSSRCASCCQKAISRESYLYNLFIYHDDEDRQMADDIKKELQIRNYDVYIAGDMQGNQHVMNTVYEKCRQSVMVLFLYSEALRQNDLANFFLQSLIIEKKGKSIMFLEVAKYKPDEVRDWTLNAKPRNDLEASHRQLMNGNIGFATAAETDSENLRSIADMDGPVSTDENHHEQDKKTEIADDLMFWKVLPRICVPKNTKSKRNMENFWCSLQNKIPRFDDQRLKLRNNKKSNRRTLTSNTPLLENCVDETQSPNRQNASPNQFSPNSNEVFTFEDTANLSRVPNDFRKERTFPDQVIFDDENEDDITKGELEATKAKRLYDVNHDIEVTVENTDYHINDDLAVKDEIAAGRQCINTVELADYAVNNDLAIRGEVSALGNYINTFPDNVLVYDADVHHREDSAPVPFVNDAGSVSESVLGGNKEADHSEIRNDAISKDEEEIFTISGEEQCSLNSPATKQEKPLSFDSETGYSDTNSSGIGIQYNSESGDSARPELLSYNSSSGVSSEFNSLSPFNQFNTDYTNMNASGLIESPGQLDNTKNMQIPQHNAAQKRELFENSSTKGNGKLNLVINKLTPSGNSPESGYITSRAEGFSSTDGFPLHTNKKIGVIEEEH